MWSDRDETALMISLNKAIGNQIVDIDRLALLLREKDLTGNDQVIYYLKNLLGVGSRHPFLYPLETIDFTERGAHNQNLRKKCIYKPSFPNFLALFSHSSFKYPCPFF